MQFDLNLAPNQSRHIDTKGTFVKYTNGNGKIRVRLDGGGYIDLLPGQGVSNVQFNSIDVKDLTGLQNAGTLLAGMYDFRDDNLYGTVSVRDYGLDLTLANKAFIASANVGPSGADNLTLIIANPANSTRTVRIKTIRYVQVGGALPPNGFRFRVGTYMPAGNLKGVSKLAGAPASQTLCPNEVITTANLNLMTVLFSITPTLVSDKFEFKEPIILPAGTSFVIHNTVQADPQTSAWYVEFTEE